MTIVWPFLLSALKLSSTAVPDDEFSAPVGSSANNAFGELIIALAMADAGMQVMVADIDRKAAEAVAAEVARRSVRSLAHEVDVTRRDEVEGLAERAYGEFDAVHLLCNNAGVTTFGMIGTDVRDEDWRWVLSVNLGGLINGIQAFVPRMQLQAGEKHVVNTASIAGLHPSPIIAPYVASKYAVVGLSECLRLDLAGRGIGVSVLCPGGVRTRILESDRNRPDALAGAAGGRQAVLAMAGRASEEERMDPADVARITLDAVRNDEFYVITRPSHRKLVEARFASILEAFDAAERRGSS